MNNDYLFSPLLGHSRAGENPDDCIFHAKRGNITALSASRGVSYRRIPACAGMTVVKDIGDE